MGFLESTIDQPQGPMVSTAALDSGMSAVAHRALSSTAGQEAAIFPPNANLLSSPCVFHIQSKLNASAQEPSICSDATCQQLSRISGKQ